MKARRKFRPSLELLENRIVPSTFSRVADLDGTAADFNLDGEFEYLETSNTQLYVSEYQPVLGGDPYEARAVMEFNISSLPANAQITSARLYGSIYTVFAEHPATGVDVSFHLQWGDGVLEGVDAYRPSVLAGQLVNQSAYGAFYVDLDPSYIQGNLPYMTYLGLSVRMQNGVHFYLDSTEAGGSLPPTLVIEYDGAAGNAAPEAINDSYSLYQGNSLVVDSPGVLANDQDANGDTLTAAVYDGPLHGTVQMASDGSFTYTPEAGYYGTDNFTYRAWDGQAYSYPAYVYLTIDPVSPVPPTANDDYITVYEDVSYYVQSPGVLANDTDPNNDVLHAVLVSVPSHGYVTLGDDGYLIYTPNANYYGGDTFSYVAFDGTYYSNVATVWVNIIGMNDAPVAANDAYSVLQDTTLTVNAPGVLANDSDIENNPLTAILVSGPAHGSLTLNAAGSFVYTPTAGYYGADSFTYRARDGSLNSATTTVSITVNPGNRAPTAANDSYSVNEDTPLTVAASGVLGNDADPDGNPISAVLVSGPTNGTLNFNADGSFTYTANTNFNGSDSFTYRASDGQLTSNLATVAITVNAVNDAPVANNDSYTLNEDQVLTIAPTPGVTSLSMVSPQGDYIGQGETYFFTPANGTFTANRNFDNGVSIFYSQGPGVWWSLDFAAPFNATLTPGFYGNATRWPFQAENVAGLNVSGEGRGSNTLTGNFTVTQAVYAADGSVLRFAATFEQSCEGFMPPLTGEIQFNAGTGPSGILLNDTDAEGSPLAITIVSGPSHGTLSMNVDGSFKYTPFANYNGADSFTYKTSDGVNESNVATVNLTINAVNDFPTAVADTYFATEDTVLNVAAPGVLANDSDVDGQSLTATLVTTTTKGTLVFNADGSFTYTPNANFAGTDSFQYAAYDGTALSFIRTVTIIVQGVNDAPVAGNDSFTTSEDTPLTVAGPGVLGNDSDVEGSALTALLVSGPSHGTLTLNSSGSFTYTADANFNGSDSFTYKARDGATDSGVATVLLTVTAVNDAPTSDAGSDQAAAEGASLSFSGAGFDVEGDALTYSWDFGDGAVASGPTATHVYADQGIYTATLTVSDGTTSSTDTLVVTVANVAPTASVNGPASGVRGQARTFTFGAADPASADQAAGFTYTINWGDGSAQTVSGLNGLQVDHVYAASGAYTVTVTATDKDGGVSSSAQQAISIAAVEMQAGALVVGGTTGVDNINLKVSDAAGGIRVTVNGQILGTFNPTDKILVYAQAGNDTVKLESVKISGVTHYIQDAAFLFGGAGNDTLDAKGSSANNVLVGGDGTDTLYGGSGRDLLLGGLGADTLRGGGGEDVLVGNRTIFDDNLNALIALMAEWGRTDADYATRTSHLRGLSGGGLNGGNVLDAATILADAAVDQLYGESGQDLFFATIGGNYQDRTNDKAGNETSVEVP